MIGEEATGNTPDRDWNLVSAAIHHYEEANRPKCFECKRALYRSEDIRCLDCNMVFCEACAAMHFWPNGREKGKPGVDNQSAALASPVAVSDSEILRLADEHAIGVRDGNKLTVHLVNGTDIAHCVLSFARALSRTAPTVPRNVIQAAEFTREDLGPSGTNYPHIRTILGYIESLVAAPSADKEPS